MQKLIEFSLLNWPLVLSFFALCSALFFIESLRGARAVSSLQLSQLVNHERAVVIDLRESKDFASGHIAGSVSVPYNALEKQAHEFKSYQSVPVILVCKLGQHSNTAAKILKKQGFTDVRRLTGGISNWQTDQLPLIKS